MRPIDADALIEFCAERWIPLNIDAVNMQPTIQPEKAQLFKEGTTFDLISRQEAIDTLDKRFDNIPMEQTAEILMLRKDLRELPTVQPEPKEGHWIRTDCGLDVECKCSKCGYRDFVEPRDEYWFKRNYCPNCGAKMRGEQHETD